MTPEQAAQHAVRAVPDSGSAGRACRIAVAHCLGLDDSPTRELWRLKLADAERALLDGRAPPRPGRTDVAIMAALYAAERSQGRPAAAG